MIDYQTHFRERWLATDFDKIVIPPGGASVVQAGPCTNRNSVQLVYDRLARIW